MCEDKQRWLDELQGDVEPWELERFQDPAEQEAAFSGELHFGTGGIREIMGIGPARMNKITIARTAQGLAMYLLQHTDPEKTPVSVVVAYDSRRHSADFARLTAGVLAANGIHVYLFDHCVSTPVLSFSVRTLGCDAGVVLTASHNPMEYNGFKVYGPTGDQATDVLARGVQACIEQVALFPMPQQMHIDEGIDTRAIELVGESLVDQFVCAVLGQSTGVACSHIKVVYSPLNGTGLEPAEKIFAACGIDHKVIDAQREPDGTFPTCPKPNPENPRAMHLAIVRAQLDEADIAVASDPDADRLGVAVNHHGEMRLLTGNEVALLLLDFLCRVGKKGGKQTAGDDKQAESDGQRIMVPAAAVAPAAAARPATPVAVTTIVSTPLADVVAQENGIELRRTLTGFKYVGEQIDLLEQKGQADRFLLGFEESCGYLRGSYVRDKDAAVALLLTCEMTAWHKAQGQDLVDALGDIYQRYGYMADRQVSCELSRQEIAATMLRARAHMPKEFAGIPVARVIDYSKGAPMPVVGATRPSNQTLPPSNVLEFRLADGSKVMLRPSGTEPKVKAYVFAAGTTQDEADDRLKSLCEGVETLLGTNKQSEVSSMLNVVLLSGGSGTRLWPLSNGARSKQFLKVLRDDEGNPESMVQRTVRLVRRENEDVAITVATSAAQVDPIALQVEQPYELSVEPERRDTAPAIMLAAANIAWKQGADPDSTVVVMPIDTYADPEYYVNVAKLDAAVQSDAADIVLLGVEPTYPSSKYGYIVPQVAMGDIRPVARFTEKPSEDKAAELITAGALWNCGVFAFKLSYMLWLIAQYSQATTYESLRDGYKDLPKNSFDYEVVEKATSVAVVPYAGAWKDLGTWNTLSEELAEPTSGKVWLDEDTCSNVHVVNETNLPVVVAGLKDAVVVATSDGVLVSDKTASAHIKGLMSDASEDRPMYERRRWGEYRVLDTDDYEDGTTVLTLSVTIDEGQQFYYQRHEYRTESWFIKSGMGEIVVDGRVMRVGPGDSVRALPGQMHAIRAITSLELVEAQIGNPLDVCDIERFGKFWE